MIIDEYPIPFAWESIPIWNRTSSRTDSDEAFEIARGWIGDCLNGSHDFCKPPQSLALPTRVVDVGLLDDVVKLIEPEDATGKYCCLSHCWGLKQIITTTRSNIQAHKREIPLELLPKTFQDAVLLTRRLGIAYIWIDSLCIVQDDDNDWKIESAKMESVYRTAHLTIAATCSSSAAGGLNTETPDYEVSGVTSSGEKYSLFFREKIDHHTENCSMDNGTSRPTVARHPLLTRAWVFQERLLSTRILHFGPYELFFECLTDIQCECNGIVSLGSSDAVPMAATKLLYIDTLENYEVYQERSGNAQHWVSRLWRTLVSSYTALQITKPQDRLPAIGGLAKSIRSKKESAYLAGLWKISLSDDLLWVIYTISAEKRPRPRPRSAPSWSWASVDTHSLYFDEIFMWHPDIWEMENSQPSRVSNHLANVVDCTVDVGGVDEFGTISRGKLTIAGAVSEGILEREVESYKGEPIIVHYVSFPGIRLPMKSDYLLDHEGSDQVLPGTKVYSLRMSTVHEGSSEFLVSLILKASNDSAVFERIGTLLIYVRPPVDINSGIYESAEIRTITIE